MAKLANVHFIGEGKVEYDGKIYVKHDGEAKAGDLAYVPSEFATQMIEDVEKGGFYRLLGDDDYYLEFIDDAGDERSFRASRDYLEIYRESTTNLVELEKRIAELERKLNDGKSESKRLTVGDYIVPLPEPDDEYSVTNTKMSLGKIIDSRFNNGGDDIRIKVVAHDKVHFVGKGYWVNPRFFRKATDEEVAEAKQIAKWAEIGREPNEFKKGDIVRYLPKNYIVEVVENTHENRTKVMFNDGPGVCTEHNEDLELVCPVERRFDRDGD